MNHQEAIECYIVFLNINFLYFFPVEFYFLFADATAA